MPDIGSEEELRALQLEGLKWTSIPAAQTGRVHLIDSDLIDRPSPRFIEGLETMAEFLHPEAFK